MTAKEYLQRVQLMAAKIENLQTDKENLRQILFSFGGGTTAERVQSSRNNDKFGTLFGRIEEKEQQIEAAVMDLTEFRLQASEQISGLDDSRYIKLLYARYIQGQRWDEIGHNLGYDTRHVFRLHKAALTAFEEKYSDMLSSLDESGT